MHDWNRDGRIDARDSFMDYQIFTESTKPRQQDSKPKGEAGAGRVLVWCIVAVVVALALITR